MLACDTKSLLPRLCIHRYKVYNNEGFIQEGSKEVKKLMDMIEPLVVNFDNLNISTFYYLLNY